LTWPENQQRRRKCPSRRASPRSAVGSWKATRADQSARGQARPRPPTEACRLRQLSRRQTNWRRRFGPTPPPVSIILRPPGETAIYIATNAIAVNGGDTPEHVSGRGLRRRRLNRRQRVHLAADLVSRERQLDPSISQVSSLLNVAPAEVSAELKARAAAHGSKGRILALVRAWNAASESEREAAILAIGCDVVWDALARVVA